MRFCSQLFLSSQTGHRKVVCFVAQTCVRALRDAGYGMRDTGCGIRDAGCGIRGAGYGVRGAGYGMRDMGSRSISAVWRTMAFQDHCCKPPSNDGLVSSTILSVSQLAIKALVLAGQRMARYVEPLVPQRET